VIEREVVHYSLIVRTTLEVGRASPPPSPSLELARIAWTVLAQERSYEARVTKAAA
jgi:hypothetical protein